MRIRAIEPGDLPAVVALLCEGFPRRDEAYWRRSLALLEQRPAVEPFSRYGVLLDVDGQVQGVLLTIATQREGIPYVNLSSWYVRPGFRQHATFMFLRATREKSAVYVNASPAPHVLPIIEAFGFRPYTGGAVLLDARAAFWGGGSVSGRGAIGRLDPATRAMVGTHLRYGCDALVIDEAGGPHVALFRRKLLKRVVPAAQFVFGEPDVLLRHAGGLMRALLPRGYPLALVDAPIDRAAGVGTPLPTRDVRYAKGGRPPAPGDLSETELSIFGP